MKGLGRDFILVVGASAVLYILVSQPGTTSDIIKQLGGASAQVIAALQGRGGGTGLGSSIPSIPSTV